MTARTAILAILLVFGLARIAAGQSAHRHPIDSLRVSTEDGTADLIVTDEPAGDHIITVLTRITVEDGRFDQPERVDCARGRVQKLEGMMFVNRRLIGRPRGEVTWRRGLSKEERKLCVGR
jgi:hypothetical protein